MTMTTCLYHLYDYDHRWFTFDFVVRVLYILLCVPHVVVLARPLFVFLYPASPSCELLVYFSAEISEMDINRSLVGLHPSAGSVTTAFGDGFRLYVARVKPHRTR